MQKNNKYLLKGIKYISSYEISGYSSAAKAYMYGLMKKEVPLTWTPIVPGKIQGFFIEPLFGKKIDPELKSIRNRRIEYDNVIMHLVPEYYPLWRRREPEKRIVGYTVWETDRIPKHWLELLNIPDILFVPTQWNKEIFERGGVTKPVYVIPHIARSLKSSTLASDGSIWGIQEDDYVFYTIGSWTTRKAIWKTVQCYLDTFKANDHTVLLIKTTRLDYTKGLVDRFLRSTYWTVKKILENYRNPARVRLITNELSDLDILQLHHRGDCYFSLCRSEGWGLGAFDAAALGKPIIITGYGGHLEYLPRQWAYLVDYYLTPVVDEMGKHSYSEDQNWAEPDMVQASHLIRTVFENKEKAGQRGSMLGQHIQENFNESLITEKLLQVLDQG